MKQDRSLSGELVDDVGCHMARPIIIAGGRLAGGRQQPSWCGQEMKQISTRPIRVSVRPSTHTLEPEKGEVVCPGGRRGGGNIST